MRKKINVVQLLDYDCGPTAIINFMRWLDHPVSRCDLRVLRELLAIRLDMDEDGTDSEAMDSMINLTAGSMSCDVSRVFSVKLDHIIDHLESGGCIILDHVDRGNEWHYSFWYMSRGKIKGINSDSDKKKPEYSKKTLKKYLDLSIGYYDHLPSCWMISKRK